MARERESGGWIRSADGRHRPRRPYLLRRRCGRPAADRRRTPVGVRGRSARARDDPAPSRPSPEWRSLGGRSGQSSGAKAALRTAGQDLHGRDRKSLHPRLIHTRLKQLRRVLRQWGSPWPVYEVPPAIKKPAALDRLGVRVNAGDIADGGDSRRRRGPCRSLSLSLSLGRASPRRRRFGPRLPFGLDLLPGLDHPRAREPTDSRRRTRQCEPNASVVPPNEHRVGNAESVREGSAPEPREPVAGLRLVGRRVTGRALHPFVVAVESNAMRKAWFVSRDSGHRPFDSGGRGGGLAINGETIPVRPLRGEGPVPGEAPGAVNGDRYRRRIGRERGASPERGRGLHSPALRARDADDEKGDEKQGSDSRPPEDQQPPIRRGIGRGRRFGRRCRRRRGRQIERAAHRTAGPGYRAARAKRIIGSTSISEGAAGVVSEVRTGSRSRNRRAESARCPPFPRRGREADREAGRQRGGLRRRRTWPRSRHSTRNAGVCLGVEVPGRIESAVSHPRVFVISRQPSRTTAPITRMPITASSGGRTQ